MCDHLRNDEDQQQYLKIYHEMIGWADVFDDISSLRRQLVIFGQKKRPPKTLFGLIMFMIAQDSSNFENAVGTKSSPGAASVAANLTLTTVAFVQPVSASPRFPSPTA